MRLVIPLSKHPSHKSIITSVTKSKQHPSGDDLAPIPIFDHKNMTEDGKSRGVGDQNPYPSAPPQPTPSYYYGTFQGVANHPQQPYPPPPTINYQPPLGFPQPIPPPTHNNRINHHQHPYYHGYQSTVPGIVIAPGTPVLIEHRPLACCGCGIGWFLFFLGFILGAVPWYVGVFILLCVRVDYREKPGLVACTLAAFLVLIAVSLGVQRAKYDW